MVSDTCGEAFIFQNNHIHYLISQHPYSVAIIAITEQMRSGGSEMYTELMCEVVQRTGPRVRVPRSSHCSCVMLSSPHLSLFPRLLNGNDSYTYFMKFLSFKN